MHISTLTSNKIFKHLKEYSNPDKFKTTSKQMLLSTNFSICTFNGVEIEHTLCLYSQEATYSVSPNILLKTFRR